MSDEQPNGHLDARLDNLIAGLAGVHSAIDAERQARLDDAETRDKENVSRDVKSRRTKIFSYIACVVGVIGIFVGGVGVTRASKADEKATATIVARESSRKITCDQANIQAAQHNSLADAFDQVLLLAIAPNPNTPRTDDQQAAIDAFYAKSHLLVDSARDPGRDCTPEGIAKFYNGN